MSEPKDLEALLLPHLKECLAKRVVLHDETCKRRDCIDPFAPFHGGQLPMSCQRLARRVNAKAPHNTFTGDNLAGFLMGFEAAPIEGGDQAFYDLGVKLRQRYKEGTL